jgi:hypothetical protein
MTRRGSLVWRVVAYLIFAQFVAFLISVAVTDSLGLAHLWAYEMTLDSLAIDRTDDLVIASLIRGRNWSSPY